MKRQILGVALACLAIPASVSADNHQAHDQYETERRAITVFQDLDAYLQNTGWKLVSGNAAFCDDALPSIGLQLQDMMSYGSPETARATLGLERDFAVQTVASGSPSGLSGQLTINREVIALGGFDPNSWESERGRRWERLKLAHDRLDELARAGPVEITFADGEQLTLDPVPVCPGRFELLGQSDEARANATRVLIGLDHPAFQYEEDEFAALVAHELGHLLLRHTQWRDLNGRSQANIRATESEADRLMPWLLANAGYDPQAAIRFFEKYRPPSGSVLFIRGTHNKWRDRVELVEAEIALIEPLIEREGAADWRTHFRREIDPNAGL